MIELLVRGFIAGSLFAGGVGGHALRLVEIDEEEKEDLFAEEQRVEVSGSQDPKLNGTFIVQSPTAGSRKNRKFVAWSAIVLYTIATFLTLAWPVGGYVLAIVGPVIGVSAVLLLKAKVDLFQKVLGGFQLVASGLSIWMLYRMFSG